MASAEPIIVVLGPWCGGTSAVAEVLHHLGVFMGTQFDWNYRELHDTWEDSILSQLCRRAFSEPGAQLQMDARSFEAQLRIWADNHRRAAQHRGASARRQASTSLRGDGFIREAWGPVVPVVVDRPVANVMASLNRLGWWKDEQERAESTAHLIAARDLALAGTPTVRVDFEALRASPAVVIRRLADELGLEVTEAQLEAAADSVVKPADVPRDVDPHQRFIDLLMPEVKRNPADVRPVFSLAEVYFHAGDFANARKWFARRLQMDSSESTEEVYWAMLRVAHSMEMLGEPWPDVHDAYLRAWEFRPTRAEPLMHSPVVTPTRTATARLTPLPCAPPKSRCPKATSLCRTQTFTRGGRPRCRRSARFTSASTSRRSCCAGVCWPAQTSPMVIGQELRETATCRCRPWLRRHRHTQICWRATSLMERARPRSPSVWSLERIALSPN